MKINLVLLASGFSRRFEGNKLLTEFKGKPIINYIIDTVKDLNFNKILLVTQYKELLNISNNIDVVINSVAKEGISSSIKIGVKSSYDVDAIMFLVCDMPFISRKTISEMCVAFENTDKNILSASHNNILINPNIFSKKYFEKLLTLTGDKGGKGIINSNLNDVEVYNIDNLSEVFDIDKKEDLDYLVALEK